jgi:hypothetical protein
MEVDRVRCVLVVPDGPSRRVTTNGLLIGRQQDCDLVGDDPKLSRRHALVRLTTDGAEIVPLGKHGIEINKTVRDRVHALHDGDRIKLPGLELVVQLTAERPDPDAAATFRLERARGGSFGITHSPFFLGGGASDDLIIKKWPEHALALRVAQRELFIEVTAGTATRNGAVVATGTLEQLAPGDHLAYRDEHFVIRQPPSRIAATTDVAVSPLPLRISIEMLPRGGRVVFAMSDGDRTVFFHDRRFDLIMALARPPGEYQPGDFIPDEVVAGVVWPRNPSASRTEINTLIARCRKDLLEAGLAGPHLVQRAPTGGATRLALAPHASVTVAG